MNEGRMARAHRFGPVPAVGRTDSLYGTLPLAGLLGFVLVIICGNVAGMVLARSVTREEEIAVRMAMGADRSTVLWQVLRDGVALAAPGLLVGGILG